MGDQFIQMPTDSTGKALRTQERVVGSNTVQVQYLIPDSPRVASGVYLAHNLSTVQASAQNGTTTAFWWLLNPVGSTVKLAFRYCLFETAEGTALTTPTSPRVALTHFTFTGTASGTEQSKLKVDSAFATATGLLKVASTGATVTLTQNMFATLVSCVQSSSSGGPASPGQILWQPREDEQPVLNAGEGIVCYQLDAGTASDTRRLNTSFGWSEYTIP